MPVPHVTALDNGLRAVVVPLPHTRSVSISIYVAAGSRYEAAPPDAGLSHFVEHLCFKGTERRPTPHAVASEIDALGGSINAATDRELTVYYAKAVAEQAERTLDVLVDILRYSLFRDEEIERERNVILEELAGVEDAPDEQASVLLDGLLWPGQPLGRDIAGTKQSIGGIDRERLRDYYHGQYVANSVVVSVAGAIETERALELVRAAADGWLPGEPASLVPVNGSEGVSRVHLLSKDTEQAHLGLGVRGLSSTDDDRYALGLLSIALGEGMSSRLFTRLREELGLCYDIHCGAAYLRDTGAFAVHAGVDPDRAEAAVTEIARELTRAREPITAEELARAQDLVRARIQLQFEDTRAVSAWYGTRVALDQPLRTPDEAIARFDAVTLDDVQRVARRLLADDQLRLAVVGPLDDASALDDLLHLDA